MFCWRFSSERHRYLKNGIPKLLFAQALPGAKQQHRRSVAALVLAQEIPDRHAEEPRHFDDEPEIISGAFAVLELTDPAIATPDRLPKIRPLGFRPSGDEFAHLLSQSPT